MGEGCHHHGRRGKSTRELGQAAFTSKEDGTCGERGGAAFTGKGGTREEGLFHQTSGGRHPSLGGTHQGRGGGKAAFTVGGE